MRTAEIHSRPSHFPIDPQTASLTDAICAEVANACNRRYGRTLRAIIMTGSMARGEATFRKSANSWRVLGDAEFLLIFHKHSEVPRSSQARCIAENIQTDLFKRHGLTCSIDLSGGDLTYLRNITPDIFGYELRNCGKVISGHAETLEEIPSFEPGQIPLEDGWRLLCNRMIEYVELTIDCGAQTEQQIERVRYHTLKLYLDMATSFLLFSGRYAPTYRERAYNLQTLATKREGSRPFPLDAFAELVTAATRQKIETQGITDVTLATENPYGEAIGQAIKLWRWQLIRLTGLPADTDSLVLMRAWMKTQTPFQKLRGWARVLRAQGWIASRHNWPHWLRIAAEGSPRYCVYASCAQLLDNRGSVREYLPLTLYDRKTELLSWTEIASELAFNYRRLLVETRA